MSLFKKLFGSTDKNDGNKPASGQRSKYMPDLQLPVDEKFTINFKKNGGKFLYCDSIEEIHESFNNILTENNWKETQVYCLDEMLAHKFKNLNVVHSNKNHKSAVFFTTCEYLVGDNGAILISSLQIKESKLKDLPDNFIVFATTSQLVNTIGEGLRGIKNKHKHQIPTNITTIKHFEINDEKDFMSYGSSSKNLYLLLLEDL
jgi:hypothetical protein